MKRILRSLVILIGLAAATSCVSDAPTTVPSTQLPAPNAELIGDLLGTTTTTLKKVTGTLLSCEPLPYAYDDKVVGPGGGTLRIGPHTLRIPAGALERSVRIFGDAPSDATRSVRLYPEGLEFERPAYLTLSYRNCSLVATLLPKVAYVSDALLILEYLPSTVDIFNQTVTGRLEHFSRYAAAW